MRSRTGYVLIEAFEKSPLADRWTSQLHTYAEYWAAVYPITWKPV